MAAHVPGAPLGEPGGAARLERGLCPCVLQAAVRTGCAKPFPPRGVPLSASGGAACWSGHAAGAREWGAPGQSERGGPGNGKRSCERQRRVAGGGWAPLRGCTLHVGTRGVCLPCQIRQWLDAYAQPSHQITGCTAPALPLTPPGTRLDAWGGAQAPGEDGTLRTGPPRVQAGAWPP